MAYNSYHERPRNYPVQSQAVQGWNPAVGLGEVHPESAVQRGTGGTEDGMGVRAARCDPVRSDEGVDVHEEGRSGGARVSGGQGGAWDAGSIGSGLPGVLPSMQGGGEAGVSSVPAPGEDGDHGRRRPQATLVIEKRARGYAIRPKGFPTIRIFPSRPLPDGCPLKALRIVRKPNRVYVLTKSREGITSSVFHG